MPESYKNQNRAKKIADRFFQKGLVYRIADNDIVVQVGEVIGDINHSAYEDQGKAGNDIPPALLAVKLFFSAYPP